MEKRGRGRGWVGAGKRSRSEGAPQGVAEELKARAISSRLVRKPPNHSPFMEAGAPHGPSLRDKQQDEDKVRTGAGYGMSMPRFDVGHELGIALQGLQGAMTVPLEATVVIAEVEGW